MHFPGHIRSPEIVGQPTRCEDCSASQLCNFRTASSVPCATELNTGRCLSGSQMTHVHGYLHRSCVLHGRTPARSPRTSGFSGLGSRSRWLANHPGVAPRGACRAHSRLSEMHLGDAADRLTRPRSRGLDPASSQISRSARHALATLARPDHFPPPSLASAGPSRRTRSRRHPRSVLTGQQKTDTLPHMRGLICLAACWTVDRCCFESIEILIEARCLVLDHGDSNEGRHPRWYYGRLSSGGWLRE